MDLIDSDGSAAAERVPIEASVAWLGGHKGIVAGSETALTVSFEPREPADPDDYSVHREAIGTVEVDNADGDGSLVLREAECQIGGPCTANEVHLETTDLQPGTYVHTFDVTWTANDAPEPAAPSGVTQARVVITAT
ncbi:hypothetical protein NUM3379_34760 [Kineococcus sp. NUM-3379]